MTPIEKRKAELREYIEARAKATQGEYGLMKLRHDLSSCLHCIHQDRPGDLCLHCIENQRISDFICKAANESSRIAEQLLECIEALNEIKTEVKDIENRDCEHLAYHIDKILNEVLEKLQVKNEA